MVFQDFLNFVPKLKRAKLGGAVSHIKMAPASRLSFFETFDLESLKPRIAAVMLLLYPKNGLTHLVLIVRNSYKGVHSDQVAFPGGKFETQDIDFATTALRETHEEVGICPTMIEIIRPFTPIYIPPSNFMVHPFLGICHQEIDFIPDPNEVAAIIELPLTTFLNDQIIVDTTITNSYMTGVSVAGFAIENHIVWGATAMILSELKDVLKPILNYKI